jgi:hypothetical protein
MFPKQLSWTENGKKENKNDYLHQLHPDKD